MLTTTTRNIGHLGLGGIYVAHVFRMMDDDGNDTYVLGLSFGNGQPIGMVTQHNASRFRRWPRLSSVEDFLAILRPKVASITVYPVDGPIQRIKDNLIDLYMLAHPVPYETTLEIERRDLFSALRIGADTDERNTDSANS